jgi:hypothetical protein
MPMPLPVPVLGLHSFTCRHIVPKKEVASSGECHILCGGGERQRDNAEHWPSAALQKPCNHHRLSNHHPRLLLSSSAYTMSSSELARKAVTQGGPPLQREPTGAPEPTAPTGSRSKVRLCASTTSNATHLWRRDRAQTQKALARKKLRKERSMRIPAIENDMMNRIGITKNGKAVARAASRKSTRSRVRSPYKTLLSEIARKKDGSQSTIGSVAEGSSGDSSGSGIDLVRCASPEPEASTSHSTCPQPPNHPTTATSNAEAKGKQKRDTPLPSRVAASSSRSAVSPHSRTPIESSEARLYASGASSPKSISPRKRSPLACSEVSPSTEQTLTAPAPVVDGSTAQPTKVQREVVSTVLGSACVSSSEESGSQSDGSSSDATSSILDDPVAGVAREAAVKESLLSQIEEHNEGKKWVDLMGFFHSLAPGEVCGVLRKARRAGRRALHKLTKKEDVAEPETSNRENEARGLRRYIKFRT